ncbi:MAG TPA: hypothetical protein VEC96_12360 [Anaerolineae bacterium]|nr:hypothetical protein [Anaerolineae bacterium]
MDEKILIKLLHMQFEHERKLREFAGKINLNYFEIDLLDVVLDAVGVPPDNTLAQIGKYGYGDWVEQPDTFSRAWYYDEFKRQVKQGNQAEYKAYLEEIFVTTTFQYLLDVSSMETSLISV